MALCTNFILYEMKKQKRKTLNTKHTPPSWQIRYKLFKRENNSYIQTVRLESKIYFYIHVNYCAYRFFSFFHSVLLISPSHKLRIIYQKITFLEDFIIIFSEAQMKKIPLFSKENDVRKKVKINVVCIHNNTLQLS